VNQILAIETKKQNSKQNLNKIMKKSILTLVALSATFSVMGQGYINFSTRVSGVVVGHVYGADPANQRITGNTASETPAGSTVYPGALLAGTGFYAQLFVDLGGGFTPVAGTLTTFRTGATLGGTPMPVVTAVQGVPIHATGTFQVRAWSNGGTASMNTYDAAVNAGLPAGNSDAFQVANLGDGVLEFPADMVNFRSFNLTIVPEPSTFVLAGLGAAALVIFRRRK